MLFQGLCYSCKRVTFDRKQEEKDARAKLLSLMDKGSGVASMIASYVGGTPFQDTAPTGFPSSILQIGASHFQCLFCDIIDMNFNRDIAVLDDSASTNLYVGNLNPETSEVRAMSSHSKLLDHSSIFNNIVPSRTHCVKNSDGLALLQA